MILVTTRRGVKFVLPDPPLCFVCRHEACAFCRRWCDVAEWSDAEDAPMMCRCEDGGCCYDSDFHERWFAAFDALPNDVELVEGCEVVPPGASVVEGF